MPKGNLSRNHMLFMIVSFKFQTMFYHDYLGTIHSILMEENFTSPKTPEGYEKKTFENKNRVDIFVFLSCVLL